MPHHAVNRLAPLLLVLAPLACTKLPQRGTPGEAGQVGVETLPSTDSIPMAWGHLVSVTPDPGGSNAFRLWFENDQGEIRILGYDNVTWKLWRRALVLRRK